MQKLRDLINIKVTASRVGDLLIIVLLFLAIFQLPMIAAFNSHDAGSVAAYEYWTLHGFAYGKDIIQNVGPLGFLNYPSIYTGLLDELKLFINALLTSYIVFLIWSRSKSQSVTIRAIFLLFAGFFAVGDVMFYILLLLVSQQLIFSTKLKIILLLTFLLALLALAKGTLFFIALFIITAYTVSCMLSRHFDFAVTAVVGFSIFILLFWLLAGQSPANFPAFVYAMASFSSGYNEAMATFESRGMQAAGFIALLGGTMPIGWKALSSIKMQCDAPQINRLLSLLAVEFFILFVVWKHGFVRADEHVAIFFQYVLVSYALALFRRESSRGGADSGAFNMPTRLLKPLGVAVVVVSLLGISVAYRISPEAILISKYYKMKSNLFNIININKLFGELDAKLKVSIAAMQLPYTRAIAGMQPISYFGMFPASMVYNGFNYISSPSTISFASWNDKIMKANAMFFRDDSRAPAYLLFDLKTIDNRLVAQDDSLAQLEILHRYKLVGFENGNAILYRTKGEAPISRTPISEREYNVGDWVDVPKLPLYPTWVKIDVHQNQLANVVGLTYKPSQYFIEFLFKNGNKKTYKFVPKMAAIGFLINPLIVENNDNLVVRSRQEFLRYMSDSHPSLNKVVKFRIGCDKQEALCGRRATVEFEEVRGLAMGNDVAANEFYRIYGQMYGFDAELLNVQVTRPVVNRDAFGKVFNEFDAPSRIKIHKPGGFKKIKGYYAMHPAAYEQGGESNGVERLVAKIKALLKLNPATYDQGGVVDGVELSVRLVTTKGEDILIFKRDLSPKEKPSDRGEQLLDLNLPSDEGDLFIKVSPKKSSMNDYFLIRKLSIQASIK
jgi:hypothetical protein